MVSLVAYVIACGWPSVTGFGTLVNVRTEDCAAASAAKALMRMVLGNMLSRSVAFRGCLGWC